MADILYAGDSELGGPANYLLGALKYCSHRVTHVPPSIKLKAGILRKKFDCAVISDYPREMMTDEAEKEIINRVDGGSGLLMVGGWGSFSGAFGNWKGSLTEKRLPVSCLGRDDRINFYQGAAIVAKKDNPVFDRGRFLDYPVICGLNNVNPKKGSDILLSARRISIARKAGRNAVSLSRLEYPLLVINAGTDARTAAFASDFAPHWCGGMVDWGKKRIAIKVADNVRIEVGERYVDLIDSLVRWLARKD
jgi:hypothetical protein